SNSYFFSSSTGDVQVQSAVPDATVAGNNVAISAASQFDPALAISNAVYTTGFPFTITNAVYTTNAGGTVTYTTSAPHGFAPGDKVTTIGNTPAGYNRTSRAVAATPTTTTFTFTGVGNTNPGAITTKGFASKDSDGYIAFTTSAVNGYAAGDLV